MGLDAVEIVMECEDEFGIRIPDEEASKVTTVGDLYDLIVRLRTSTVGIAPAGGFTVITDALRQAGVEIDSLDSSAPLASVVPAGRRRVFWNDLDERLGGRLPSLVAPRWGCGVAIAWMVLSALLTAPVGAAGIVVGLAAGGLTSWIAAALLRQSQPAFPRRWRTAQEIMDRTTSPISQEAIWNRLVAILCEQLAVPPDRVTPQARLVEDLHMG